MTLFHWDGVEWVPRGATPGISWPGRFRPSVFSIGDRSFRPVLPAGYSLGPVMNVIVNIVSVAVAGLLRLPIFNGGTPSRRLHGIDALADYFARRGTGQRMPFRRKISTLELSCRSETALGFVSAISEGLLLVQMLPPAFSACDHFKNP